MGSNAVQSDRIRIARLNKRESGLLHHFLDGRLRDKRKTDPKCRTAVIPILRRYHTLVRLDNGARDGKPHPHAFRLAVKKKARRPHLTSKDRETFSHPAT